MHLEPLGDAQQIKRDLSLFARLRESAPHPDTLVQGSLPKIPIQETPIQETVIQEPELTLMEWVAKIDEAEYHSKGAFKRLVNKLRAKGYSKEKAADIAADAGRKKFGKDKFQKMASQGKEWHEKHENLQMSARDAFFEGAFEFLLEDLADGPAGGMGPTQSSGIGPYKRASVGGASSSQEEPEQMTASQKEELRKLVANDHQLLGNMKAVHNKTAHPQVKAHLEREITHREHTLSMLGDILGNE